MSRLPLPALLSHALIAFTLEFDAELDRKARELGIKKSPPSLSMWLNVLRFVAADGIDERRLPALSGISKPATRISVACLERHGWVAVRTSDAGTKTVRLTPRARKLWNAAYALLDDLEKQWSERFDAGILRDALEAATRTFATELPQYPVVLPNRGGTPTGL